MDDAFTEMPCDESLERLLEGLRNPHHLDFFLEAKQNLVKIGEPAVKMLIEVLRDNNEPLLIRARVGKILGEIGESAKKPLEVLMDDLKDKDIKTRELAVKTLMGIR